jgi:hypothetical protein
VSLELPLSARLAWWLTAWLRGAEVTDHVLDAVTDGDLAHVVDGLSGGTAMLDLLLEARRSDAVGAGLALPVEGDLLGLGGPRDLNDAAIESGEAVIVGSWAAVPEILGEVCHWRVLPAAPRQLPDVGEADRSMRSALMDSANLLADLGRAWTRRSAHRRGAPTWPRVGCRAGPSRSWRWRTTAVRCRRTRSRRAERRCSHWNGPRGARS